MEEKDMKAKVEKRYKVIKERDNKTPIIMEELLKN